MSDEKTASVPIEHAVRIVAAYVGNNHVPRHNLVGVIEETLKVLKTLTAGEGKPVQAVPLIPAVPIRKSITDEHIVCLEDGKKYKSLKRHLMTRHNLSPEDYRLKWKLPADYPIVAPNYAATRSTLALSMGLGRKAAAVPKLELEVAREASAEGPKRSRKAVSGAAQESTSARPKRKAGGQAKTTE